MHFGVLTLAWRVIEGRELYQHDVWRSRNVGDFSPGERKPGVSLLHTHCAVPPALPQLPQIYGPSSFPASCQMDLQLGEEALHSLLSSEVTPLGCQQPHRQEFPPVWGLTLTWDLSPWVTPLCHTQVLGRHRVASLC